MLVLTVIKLISSELPLWDCALGLYREVLIIQGRAAAGKEAAGEGAEGKALEVKELQVKEMQVKRQQ